mgnify:CR=1 FL=1
MDALSTSHRRASRGAGGYQGSLWITRTVPTLHNNNTCQETASVLPVELCPLHGTHAKHTTCGIHGSQANS